MQESVYPEETGKREYLYACVKCNETLFFDVPQAEEEKVFCKRHKKQVEDEGDEW